MGKFERFLTLWVALRIMVGIGLGQAMPGVFHALGAATVAQVNLPVAVLMSPEMCALRFTSTRSRELCRDTPQSCSKSPSVLEKGTVWNIRS
jgi:ACR3 family arsenite efflux pump ArsB